MTHAFNSNTQQTDAGGSEFQNSHTEKPYLEKQNKQQQQQKEKNVCVRERQICKLEAGLVYLVSSRATSKILHPIQNNKKINFIYWLLSYEQYTILF